MVGIVDHTSPEPIAIGERLLRAARSIYNPESDTSNFERFS